MKSSTNQYWIALDHVRALAALMVFIWHFTHGSGGSPVPFEGAPAIFPLALFDEGHFGVAVFMTLSGYLFAKLLEGKAINYPNFFWNRLLRLAPLLLFVFLLRGVVEAISGADMFEYASRLVGGLIWPTWPNGGWSITVEMHFYLMLPLLLLVARSDPRLLLAIIAAAIAFRAGYFYQQGTVQDPAYWTIVGRIDQFVLGMLFFMQREWIGKRIWLVLGALTAFCAFYWAFDFFGGFYLLGGGTPSPSPLWIVLTTIEGLAVAIAITWYDRNYRGGEGLISRLAADYGKFSYSIYLLHPFIVFRAARFIDERIIALDNFYLASLVGFLVFLAMYPIGWASYRFIEKPFLRYRTRYVFPRTQAAVSPTQ